MTYHDVQEEHECPTPLDRPVKEFNTGGQVFTPAGRWETIRNLSPECLALQVQVTTDRAVWMWWGSDKLPYIPDYRASAEALVRVREGSMHIEVAVGTARSYGRGHVLAFARAVRGAGWEISDRPGGAGELENVTVPSKARARTEMNRRARAHAKRLGVRLDGAR